MILQMTVFPDKIFFLSLSNSLSVCRNPIFPQMEGLRLRIYDCCIRSIALNKHWVLGIINCKNIVLVRAVTAPTPVWCRPLDKTLFCAVMLYVTMVVIGNCVRNLLTQNCHCWGHLVTQHNTVFQCFSCTAGPQLAADYPGATCIISPCKV